MENAATPLFSHLISLSCQDVERREEAEATFSVVLT